MLSRRRRLLGDIPLSQCVGIEIGALHSPVVPRSEGRVFYVDYAPTEELRTTLQHPNVDPADLVEVDIIWGEQPLNEALTEKVDYAVASHVIEHVPDLIGWLLELHAALKPGGILGLAIPDRRYTFDARRNDSGLAEMVEAHARSHRRPSLRQIVEAAALSKPDPAEDPPGVPAEVLDRLPGLFAWAKLLAREPRYVDVHCWVFTPASFLDNAEGLARIGCFPYAITGFYPTEPGALEFQVRLRAVADSADASVSASIAAARKTLAAIEPSPTAASTAARVTELEAHNQQLEAALRQMQTSTSWRLTAPLRAVSRLARRRR